MNLKGFRLCCFLIISASLSQAQDAVVNTIKTNFEIYSKRAIQEKLYLHIDRPLYIVGETLWFKAYMVDASTNQNSSMSKVGYLEILDRENNAVAQTKFQLADGRGDGSLIIPSSIASGTYKVRSYTSWMKNFSAEYYFESNITIINSFVAFDPNPEKDAVTKYDLQFFPEGGDLVAGLESKIGFRATNIEGLGVDFTAQVFDNNREVVANFRPAEFGIGNFSFTPKENQNYTAELTDEEGNKTAFKLPQVLEKGIVMHLSEAGDKLEINIRKSTDINLETLYLVAHTRQGSPTVTRIEMNNKGGTTTIDKASLGDGISQLTIVDQKMNPICERLFFKFPKSALAVTGKVGKPVFTTREKVTVDVASSLGNGAIAGSDFSIAIFREDGIKAMDPTHIAAYMLLTSDLKGNVESPEYYFNNKNEQKNIAVDNLMLTHGWRRFEWTNVLNNSAGKYKFLPEYQGHFITGTLTDKNTGAPAVEKELFLAAPDFPVRLYTTYSEREGFSRFEVKDFWGPKELTVQTNLVMDSTYQFQIDNPFSKQISSKLIPAFNFDKANEQLLLTRTINMQTRNAFLPKNYLEGDRSISDTLAFFGLPDERYSLDDFTRFPTMEEVFREYVRGVLVRRKQKEFHFKMIDKLVPNTIYNSDPLVLLDGIPIFDIGKIMAFDPLKIKKIELMDAKYFMGSMAFTGIVSMTTYRNDLAGFELDPRIQVMPYEGIQYHREFYAPKYENTAAQASRIPDFRNLLYWNPNVTVDATGSTQLQFFTSDQTGKYRVVVQGMSKNGSFGSNSFSFEIDKKGI